MQIDVQATAPLRVSTPCLVIPIWQDTKLSGPAANLDKKLNRLISGVIAEDGYKGTVGETRVLYTQDTIPAPRVILMGIGKQAKMSTTKLRHAVAKAARGVRAIKRESFALAVPAVAGIEPEQAAIAVTEGILLGLHVFNDFKTDEDSKGQTKITGATLLVEDVAAARRGVAYGQLTATANIRARGWVNLPSNLKSPKFLAEQAQEICARNGLECDMWDETRIQAERMGALYAVGMGSDNPPRFIIMEYAPPGMEKEPPIILVGKGMSYDTGGYSLKPTTSMEDMKDDMAGAAVVLGAMSAIAELKPKRRVIGLVPSAENMVSGNAQRPGDIVTARNGKTIEVVNTDAEGRLILADALSYACELKPAAIIDFATLTGAIGVAIGQEAAGLFATDEALADKIEQAAEITGDRVWRFPLWDEYKEHVKGSISDLKNVGQERRAGAIAGAVFLENFVADDIPWAHIDMAAVALIREDRPLSARGATGYGVRLTLELLKNW
ncbi:MAG: leucyl aminopeptidase [Abitibacteriaceae bacterium]|nr:leucyl aminopeptidase [Abditibacteriaceae bacterium]